MCGIAGILTKRGHDVPQALAAMRGALAHRGPDDSGVAELDLGNEWRLGLVQTRLSILDLTPAGHQPMQEPATGSIIAFNGEIYNHEVVRKQFGNLQFSSTGDTATLLQTWIERGSDVLDQMRGMFAFILWDARRRQLWLVRDRLGVKPLYLARIDDATWLFASEIRALLATGLVDKTIDPAGLQSYLATGAVVAPRTILASIESLMPGERRCCDFSAGAPQWTSSMYWRPEFARTDARKWRREEALEWLRPVLAEATRLRMVADVPVGVFLSGGIDSGAVVSSLATQGFKLRTFAVVFDEQEFDESSHSRRIAHEFGTDHVELRLRPTEMVTDLDRAIAAYDQPSIDGINTYFISRATRQTGAKVALSGLGGDELFAGYPYFRIMQRMGKPLQRAGLSLTHALGRTVRPMDVRFRKLGALLGSRSRNAQYDACRQVMAPLARRELLIHPPAVGDAADFATNPALDAEVAELDPVNAHSRLELSNYLANMLLRDTDQMSMAHALEVREPLLDHVLVETLGQIPGSLKLLPGVASRSKGLLADALERPLPVSTLARRKMGFVLPWEKWLRSELAPRVASSLANRNALEVLGMRPDAVAAVWRDFQARRSNARYTDILCIHHLIEWTRINLC